MKKLFVLVSFVVAASMLLQDAVLLLHCHHAGASHCCSGYACCDCHAGSNYCACCCCPGGVRCSHRQDR